MPTVKHREVSLSTDPSHPLFINHRKPKVKDVSKINKVRHAVSGAARVDIAAAIAFFIALTAIPSLFLAAYLRLETIKEAVVSLCTSAPYTMQMWRACGRHAGQLAPVHSFFSIILINITVLPITKTLTAEISSDTIWLHFGFCQALYCLATTRVLILRGGPPLRAYQPCETIPLEESLLIPRRRCIPNVAASVFAVIGFILVFSRLSENLDILYLQVAGFLLYFCVPPVVAAAGVHRSGWRLCLFIGSATAALAAGSPGLAAVYACGVAGLYAGLRVLMWHNVLRRF